jgi:crossover junction endodeoxyribonuclease RuvC
MKGVNNKGGEHMIILGIDLGLATLGYGLIRKDENGRCEVIDYGVVTTPKEESLPTRLVLLEDGINQILRTHRPDQIAMEELFFSKNITTGIAVAHARGVALLACVKYCPYLFEYTPMQIKQALTGYGRAEKAQIQQVVTTMLGLEKIPRPDDAADALAIALCHATVSRFGNLFKVNNMTRTKGNNTAEGNAFQKLLAEQEKKEKKKATPKPKKVEKKPTPAGAVFPPMGTVKPKKVGAGTASSILKQPQRLNTAAEIARQIAAQMESKGE